MSLEIVERVREKYPEGPFGFGAVHAEFLLEVGRALGCALWKKGPPGKHVVLPDGTTVSGDFVVLANREAYDILIDSRLAAWQPKGKMEEGEFLERAYWPPPPMAPPPPTPSIVEQLEALRVAVEGVEQRLATQALVVDELAREVGRRFEALVVEGSTSRVWGHAHMVRLGVLGDAKTPRQRLNREALKDLWEQERSSLLGQRPR